MKRKLAILTNVVSPYRLPVFGGLANSFDLVIATSSREIFRVDWPSLDSDLEARGARVKRITGWFIRAGEEKVIHLNPGYLPFLFKERPAAVISGEMGLRTICAVLYCRISRTPLWIWSEATNYTERRPDTFRTLVRSWITRYPARWITFGVESTEYLLSIGVKRPTIVQVQNGVDEKQFTVNGDSGPGSSPRPMILAVGQLIARKGYEPFLESVHRVKELGYSFSIRIIGTGPRLDSLKSHAQALGLSNVEFVGGLLPDKLPAHYRVADALVFPTLEDIWGLVVNEALLCGTPVVCSKYAGCAADLLDPDDIFDPLIPEEIDRALIRAISGKATPPNIDRIWPMSRVVEAIVTDVQQILGP